MVSEIQFNPKVEILLHHRVMEIMEKGLQDHENVKAKYEALGRAADILTVLKATLNMEQGGELA